MNEDQNKEIDMGELLAEHRFTLKLDTSAGPIIMGHVPYLKIVEMTAQSMMNDPEYETALADLQTLKKLLSYPDAEHESIKTDMEKLLKIVKPHTFQVAILVFRKPILKTIEDYEALLGSLNQEEANNVQALVNTFTDSSPSQEANANAIRLVMQFNIPLASDLTAENLTAHQAFAMAEAMEPPKKPLLPDEREEPDERGDGDG